MIETNMIPLYMRIIAGVFALVNIGYGIAGYFPPLLVLSPALHNSFFQVITPERA